MQPSRMQRVAQKKRKKKKIRLILASVFAFLLLFGGYYAYNLYSAVAQGHDSATGKSKIRKDEVSFDKPFTVLLIGADRYNASKEDKEGWRPDVMMLAVINPKVKQVKMVSIPRDTYFTIADTNSKTKINAASAALYTKKSGLSDIESVRRTAENFFYDKIPIDYYAKINFSGFMQLVDQVGGIDVNVPYTFKWPSFGGKMIYFQKGPMHLNGEEALVYVRQRKKDPEGDAGRNKRQQEAIQQVLNKMVSFKSLTQFTKITDVIGSNFNYSFNPTDLLDLMNIYTGIEKQNIQSIKLYNYPQRIDPHGDCQIVPEKERERVTNELLKAMDQPYDEQALLYDPLDPNGTKKKQESGNNSNTTDTSTEGTSNP